MHVGILYTVGTIIVILILGRIGEFFGYNWFGLNDPEENDNTKPRKPQDYL